jgi:hypothetical protein
VWRGGSVGRSGPVDRWPKHKHERKTIRYLEPERKWVSMCMHPRHHSLHHHNTSEQKEIMLYELVCSSQPPRSLTTSWHDAPRSFTGEYAEMNTRNYGSNQFFDVYSPVISTVYGQVGCIQSSSCMHPCNQCTCAHSSQFNNHCTAPLRHRPTARGPEVHGPTCSELTWLANMAHQHLPTRAHRRCTGR